MAAREVIVIGGSTGAFSAFQRLCAGLPADLPAAVLVTLHVGRQGQNTLAEALTGTGPLRAVAAADGAPMQRGTIYVAPPDRHMMVLGDAIRLGSGPRENMSRPAIDPLFRSAALSHGPGVIGVVLSGMLNDGAAGLAAIKQCGGVSIVQNPADAQADEMPLSAMRAAEIDYRASADALGPLLSALAREEAGPARPIPPEISLEVDIALGRPSDTPTLRRMADPVAISCPSCGGVLSEMRISNPLRYRCQIGHSFTAEVLDEAQSRPANEALAVALRITEERVTLMERMAQDAAASGRTRSAAMFEERRSEYRRHADTIRNALLAHDPGLG